MDRLSALIIGLGVAAAACDKGKDEPPASRVDNAKVGSKQIATVEAFCDYLAKDDASGLTLKMIGGIEQMIPRNQIKVSSSSGLSLMPEGIEAGMDAQAMADLLTFIEELK